jgi:predicted PurR-regulated permease PerM
VKVKKMQVKKIVLILVSITFFTLLFFLIQNTFNPINKDFEQGFNELKKLIGPKFEGFVSLQENFSTNELNEIDSKLFNFKSKQENTALRDLATIFEQVIKVHFQKNSFLKQKKVIDSLDSESVCFNLSSFELLETETNNLVNQIIKLTTLLDSFSLKHFNLFEREQNILNSEINSLNQQKSELSKAIFSLKKQCLNTQ